MMDDWYQKEPKTRQGETIIFDDYYGNHIDYVKSELDVYMRNNEKDLYFKPVDSYKSRWEKESLYAEIIFSQIANALGIQTVALAPAIKVKSNGDYVPGLLMSDLNEDTNNTRFLPISGLHGLVDENKKSCDERSLVSTVKALKKYRQILLANGAKEVHIDKNIVPYFKQMIFMDYITHNFDRHDQNGAFLVQKNENNIYHIKAAKIFDNEMSFMFYHFSFSIRNRMRVNVPKILDEGMIPFDYYYSLEDIESKLTAPREYEEQIVNAVKHDEVVRNLYNKAKALDLDQVLKEISYHYNGFEIPKAYLKLAKEVVEYKIKRLTKALKNEMEQDF